MPAQGCRLNGTRWLVFNTVGAIGLIVQVACLWTLRNVFGLHYLLAASLAIELTILHNFFWHSRWTWADRAVRPADLVGRLVRFNLTNGAISIIGNLVVMAALVELVKTHYLVAQRVLMGLAEAIALADVLDADGSGHQITSAKLVSVRWK